MKRFVVITVVFLAISFPSGMSAFIGSGLPASSGGGPAFEYVEDNNRLHLGTIFLDELDVFNLEIEFVNSGDAPLTVTRAWGCCGTRIKQWTREPVLPGDTGTIEVTFRLAPRVQSINRTVSAQSNDPSGTKVLRITGQLKERQAVEFLK